MLSTLTKVRVDIQFQVCNHQIMTVFVLMLAQNASKICAIRYKVAVAAMNNLNVTCVISRNNC